MRAILRLLPAALLLAGVAPLSGQPAKARVDGRVLSVSGQPVPGASVNLLPAGTRGAAPAQIAGTTDDQGNFSIRDIEPGRYTMTIEKGGYVTQQYGAGGGQPAAALVLEAGQTVEGITVRLVPAASISGRVVTGDGAAVPMAQVTVFRYVHTRGARRLNPAGYTARADENGAFRFGNLAEGRYYLRAEGSPAGVPTYYPSTPDPEAAAVIDLLPGMERQSADIRMVRTATYSVRGKAVDPSGAPAENAALYILAEKAVETLTPPPRIVTKADGSFEFPDLLPGAYTIRAVPGIRVASSAGAMVETRFAGRLDVRVGNKDVEDLEFRLSGGVQLTGVLRMDDNGALPKPQIPAGVPLPPGAAATAALRAVLVDSEQTFTMGGLMGAADPSSGAFRIQRIIPGRYYLVMEGLPRDIYVKSVRMGGQDLTRSSVDLSYGDGELEVVLSAGAGQIGGTARNDRGEPVARAAVALWPETPNLSNSNSGVLLNFTDEGGNVRFSGLRPERYHVLAFEAVDPAVARSPEFLARFRERAARIDLTAGASAEQNIPVAGRGDVTAALRQLP